MNIHTKPAAPKRPQLSKLKGVMRQLRLRRQRLVRQIELYIMPHSHCSSTNDPEFFIQTVLLPAAQEAKKWCLSHGEREGYYAWVSDTQEVLVRDFKSKSKRFRKKLYEVMAMHALMERAFEEIGRYPYESQAYPWIKEHVSTLMRAAVGLPYHAEQIARAWSWTRIREDAGRESAGYDTTGRHTYYNSRWEQRPTQGAHPTIDINLQRRRQFEAQGIRARKTGSTLQEKRWFDVIGVAEDESDWAVIKQKYRAEVKNSHPDSSKKDVDEFVLLSSAYEVAKFIFDKEKGV